MIAEDDPRLVTEAASYDAAGTKVGGYLARLKGGTKRPAVVVIHENRGLNPHIKDVARHLASTASSRSAWTPCRPSAARPRTRTRPAR